MSSGDPVGWGLVESLPRPGGNVTGVSNLLHEITPKQLDLLREALPQANHVAVLMGSQYPSHRAALASIQTRARSTGIKVLAVQAASEQEISRGFELMAREGVQAVLVMSSPFFAEQHEQIVSLSHRTRIPCVGDGGRGFLLGYWAAFDEMFQRGAELVHKILQGAKPAELPIIQSTRFRLTVDVKAALAIGVDVPQSLRMRADRVFE